MKFGGIVRNVFHFFLCILFYLINYHETRTNCTCAPSHPPPVTPPLANERMLFFSSSASKMGSTHPRCRGYLRSGVSLRDNQAWLLKPSLHIQAFHNLRLIHFHVFRMRQPDLLQEQERGPTSLQSFRACTAWLFRIIYKLCVLKHLVRDGRSPAYLSDVKTSLSSFRLELPWLN